MMTINWKQVKHYMIDAGIRSDAELARRANVHPNTFLRSGGFRSDTVDRLAECLGCHPFELISVEEREQSE